jgi:hypothetical protein
MPLEYSEFLKAFGRKAVVVRCRYFEDHHIADTTSMKEIAISI